MSDLGDSVEHAGARVEARDGTGTATRLGAAAMREAVRRELDAYAQTIGGWFWETDAEHRFVYMSASVETLVGVKPEWHYGKTRAELAQPGTAQTPERRAHDAALANHEPFDDFVFLRRGPDGLRWLTTSGRPVFDADGCFRGYRGTARDITSQVLAERQSERLRAAVEGLSDMFSLWDPDDRLVFCNRRFREMNRKVARVLEPGVSFETYLRAGIDAGQFPEARGREEAFLADRLDLRRSSGSSQEQRRADGSWLLVSEHRLPDGYTATIGTDITARKRHEERLNAEHELLDSTLSTMPDGLEVLDANMRLVAWNDQLFDILKVSSAEVLDATVPHWMLRDALRALRASSSPEAAARGDRVAQEEWLLNDGRWLEVRRTPLRGGGQLSLYRDITASKRLAQELEYRASHDALTGLRNRGSLLEMAARELARAQRYRQPLSVLMIDIDHFKDINDGFGHAAGDEVLAGVARTCVSVLREMDVCGRLGGEEFAVLLPQVGLEGARAAAERVRRAIQSDVSCADCQALTVTVSIGVAEAGPGHDNAEQLLQAADKALYVAKNGGRNRVECVAT